LEGWGWGLIVVLIGRMGLGPNCGTDWKDRAGA